MENQKSSFLSLPNEKLIIYKREHWFTLIPTILSSFTLIISIISFGFLIFIFLINSIILLFAYSLLLFSVFLIYSTKTIIDWYFHMYIITSRRLLEFSYSPLFSNNINDVFLNQVRTIEVDEKINTTIFELMDIGDVSIVFDRFSKEEVFVLKNIKNPRQTAISIGNVFEQVIEKYQPLSIPQTNFEGAQT